MNIHSITELNGLKIQWGYNTASGYGATYSFPIAFTSMWFGASSNRQGWVTGGINYVSLTKYQVVTSTGSQTYSDKVSWIAIGY